MYHQRHLGRDCLPFLLLLISSLMAALPMLPMDILSHVLCRLPVKTLLHFRCVSKKFSTLIDDSGFINYHLQYQYQIGKYSKLIHECWYQNLSLAVLDMDLVDNYAVVEFPYDHIEDNRFDYNVNQKLPVEDIEENRFVSVVKNVKKKRPGHPISVHVIGSCNGLLAVCRSGPGVLDIILWNMSTKKHKTLPKCDFIEDSYIKDSYITQRKYFRGGFGYDASTDDYKLIIHKLNQVVVYSLKANSWRRIDSCPRNFYLYEGVALVKDIAVRWLLGAS